MVLPRLKLLVPAALLTWACASAALDPLPEDVTRYGRSGSYTVAVGDAVWPGAATGSMLLARIYYPREGSRHPVVIFSHGLGNSRFGYGDLGRQWASWGFIAVHLEHPGAGEDLARRGWLALYRAGFDRRLWTTTPSDVHLALDRLLGSDTVPPFLRDRIDPSAIGVAGHSLGAYVALATSGAIGTLPGGDASTLRDRRVRAAVALSMSENLPASAYGSTDVPILHMTGTADSSLFYGTTQRMRRIPFDHVTGAPQMLVTLRGANHSTFSLDDRTATPERVGLIKALTTAWFLAQLERDAGAAHVLSGVTLDRNVAQIERK